MKELFLFSKNHIFVSFSVKFQELDANKTCFLIQKRVDPFYQTLEKLIQEKRSTEAKLLLSNLLTLLVTRLDLGYHKPTHKFHDNFGCIGLKAVQLDIGRLLTYQDLGKDETPLPSYANLHLSTIYLKQWLEEKDQDLALYWTQIIQNLEQKQA